MFNRFNLSLYGFLQKLIACFDGITFNNIIYKANILNLDAYFTKIYFYTSFITIIIRNRYF